MKIPKDIDLTKMVYKDRVRPAMCNVLFDKGKLVATDGHKLVVIEAEELLEGEKDKKIILPIELFDKKKKLESFNLSSGSIQLDFAITETYPDYETLIPTDDKIEYEISFAPKLLYELWLSMGQKNIKLKFYGKGAAIKIECLADSSRFGLLMPMRFE